MQEESVGKQSVNAEATAEVPEAIVAEAADQQTGGVRAAGQVSEIIDVEKPVDKQPTKVEAAAKDPEAKVEDDSDDDDDDSKPQQNSELAQPSDEQKAEWVSNSWDPSGVR